jgi:hypothetical protein
VVVKNKFKLEEEEARVHDHETPFEETCYKKLDSNFIDNQEVKMALSNWKEMRKQFKIDEERRIARFQLEQIKNTAGFNDNMDAMRGFHNLARSPMDYPTCTRTQCFGRQAKEDEDRFLNDS